MDGAVHDLFGESAVIDQLNTMGAVVIGLSQLVMFAAGFATGRLATGSNGVGIAGGVLTMRAASRVLSRWLESGAGRPSR